MFQSAAQQLPAEPAGGDSAVLFEDVPVVEAASLHIQTLREAPASVTVISGDDIRKYGYRTLGEALTSARGFYITDDRSYRYVGLRGFSLPGDYNTRFLVMLNGHPLTENVYGSNGFFGQDFGLDMDLVKRIEIVRGPSSALYGSNGIFTTVNIVTESPVESVRGRLSTELASHGQRKLHASSSVDLGHGANLLVSGSVFNNAGQSLYFPEFDSPETANGRAVGVDGERGYHSFANLVWDRWSVFAYFNSREKQLPTAPYGTIFNDRGNRQIDSRNFIEAAYARDVGASGRLNWRLSYDHYGYNGRFDYASEEGVLDNRDLAVGDWVGSRLTCDFDLRRAGRLTLGGELTADLRAVQENFDLAPQRVQYLSLNTRRRFYAGFAQQEFRLSERWNAYAGVRLDGSTDRGAFASPRLALIYSPSTRTSLKILAGRAFRNPSAFEQYYDDHGMSQIPNVSLRPETALTFEVALERQLTKRLNATVAAYRYSLEGLIEGVRVDDAVVQYRNASATGATGVELELNGHAAKWLELAASYSYQRATEQSAPLVNSPRNLGKLRAAVPLVRERAWAAVAAEYVHSRLTMAGQRLAPFWLADATFSAVRVAHGLDLQVGVRNLLDRRYDQPVGPGHVMDALAADGRTAFVKLTWSGGE